MFFSVDGKWWWDENIENSSNIGVIEVSFQLDGMRYAIKVYIQTNIYFIYLDNIIINTYFTCVKKGRVNFKRMRQGVDKNWKCHFTDTRIHNSTTLQNVFSLTKIECLLILCIYNVFNLESTYYV